MKETNKPLFRWTVGGRNIKENGLYLLKESVESVINIYQDDFDYLICFNNLTRENEDFIDSIGIPTFPIDSFRHSLLPQNAQHLGRAWKLSPARLRLESHEIILDNDVVLTGRCPQIDHFLHNNMPMITEGRNRSYGVLKRRIKRKHRLNSGILGYPPNYDMDAKVQGYIRKHPFFNLSEGYGYNEQGLIALIITPKPFILIPMNYISVCEEDGLLTKGKFGIHFVRANIDDNHTGVNEYKLLKSSKLLF